MTEDKSEESVGAVEVGMAIKGLKRGERGAARVWRRACGFLCVGLGEERSGRERILAVVLEDRRRRRRRLWREKSPVGVGRGEGRRWWSELTRPGRKAGGWAERPFSVGTGSERCSGASGTEPKVRRNHRATQAATSCR